MTIPISPLNAAKMARGVYGIRFSTQIVQGMVDGGGPQPGGRASGNG